MGVMRCPGCTEWIDEHATSCGCGWREKGAGYSQSGPGCDICGKPMFGYFDFHGAKRPVCREHHDGLTARAAQERLAEMGVRTPEEKQRFRREHKPFGQPSRAWAERVIELWRAGRYPSRYGYELALAALNQKEVAE